LTTALLVLAVYAGLLIGGPIDFMYRSVPDLIPIRNLASIAATVAAILLLLGALVVAFSAALQRLGFGAKLLAVLPLWLVLFTMVGVVMNLTHTGTVGIIGNFGLVMVTLAVAWLVAGAVTSTIAVVIAAGRARLGAGAIRAGLTLTRLSGIVALVAGVAMAATVAIVSGSTPSFGGPGGGPGGQPQRPAATQPAASPASTAEATAGGFALPEATQAARDSGPGVNTTPEVTAGGPVSTEAAPGGTRGQNGGGNGAPGGQGGQRGQGNGGGQPQGAPGGGGFNAMIASFQSQFKTVGIVVAVLAVVELIALLGSMTAPAPVAIASREGTAFFSGLAAFVVVTIIIGGAMQLVQVPHDNPPANGTLNFDSPQTQALFEGACADCHTNDTQWPWYAYVAPAAWLNSIHVHDARGQMNLSALNAMPAFRKQGLAQSIEMQLRSGNMPPVDYQLMHPAARLTDEQKQQLIDGMKATLAQSP
jgi:hypothetical protein